jgi:hypothetical protein
MVGGVECSSNSNITFQAICQGSLSDESVLNGPVIGAGLNTSCDSLNTMNG